MSKEKRGTSDDAPRFSLLIVCGNLKKTLQLIVVTQQPL